MIMIIWLVHTSCQTIWMVNRIGESYLDVNHLREVLPVLVRPIVWSRM